MMPVSKIYLFYRSLKSRSRLTSQELGLMISMKLLLKTITEKSQTRAVMHEQAVTAHMFSPEDRSVVSGPPTTEVVDVSLA